MGIYTDIQKEIMLQEKYRRCKTGTQALPRRA